MTDKPGGIILFAVRALSDLIELQLEPAESFSHSILRMLFKTQVRGGG